MQVSKLIPPEVFDLHAAGAHATNTCFGGKTLMRGGGEMGGQEKGDDESGEKEKEGGKSGKKEEQGGESGQKGKGRR
jgi:hypothetical protein